MILGLLALLLFMGSTASADTISGVSGLRVWRVMSAAALRGYAGTEPDVEGGDTLPLLEAMRATDPAIRMMTIPNEAASSPRTC